MLRQVLVKVLGSEPRIALLVEPLGFLHLGNNTFGGLDVNKSGIGGDLLPVWRREIAVTKSYFIDEQEGSGELQLKSGRSGRVRWKLEFRSDGLSGHIRGERELLELAAKDTQATIRLCHEVLLFAVGPYKQCGTPVSAECEVEPWQTATTHTRGRMFVVFKLTRTLRIYLLIALARSLRS